MPVLFHHEDVEYTIPDNQKLEKWLIDIAIAENKEILNINYIFCSDEYLLNINKEYLDHDFYTDIITFPYKEGKQIESDIFISIDRVIENAKTYKTAIEHELLRVIAHGLLHLLGYGDKSEEESLKMSAMEEQCIAKF
ncbi:MAG: rRNA maturation RNase YbeY [Saprospiraceae bacterium]